MPVLTAIQHFSKHVLAPIFIMFPCLLGPCLVPIYFYSLFLQLSRLGFGKPYTLKTLRSRGSYLIVNWDTFFFPFLFLLYFKSPFFLSIASNIRLCTYLSVGLDWTWMDGLDKTG